MAEDNDAASKTEEPSGKKLADARRRGEVVKTPDLSSLMSLVGAFSVVAVGGGWLAQDMMTKLTPFLAHPDAMSLDGSGGVDVGRNAVMAAMPTLLAVCLVAGLAGAAGNLLQTGFMFTPDKLKPDFSKFNLLSSFKRLFSLDNFMNFIKSAVKIFVTGIVAWMTLRPHAAEIYNLPGLPISEIMPLTMKLAQALMISVVCFLALTAGADWLYQRQSFLKKMRMTKEEVKDEYKNQEGDPHVKARQKQLRMEKARRRMMQNVAKATVVVMNPTHYAVALRYEPGETAAPMCVAKGMDDIALKIRSVAEDNGVEVIEDPPLARALYATTEIDQQIPEEHFAAVAKVIGFIMNRRRKTAAPRRARASAL
jgi:flagellar biosynthetic protein FlhB